MNNVALPTLDWRIVFNRSAPPGQKGWGRVRAAQINELIRALSAAAWGQAVHAVLLTLILARSVGSVMLGLWLLALSLMMLLGFIQLRGLRETGVTSASRKAVDRAGYNSVVFGFIWAVPSVFFFPVASPPEQLAICLVTAGMMAGATFIFSSVPPAAAGYLLAMGAAVTAMLGTTRWPIITAIGPFYTVGLLLIVYSSGRAFMQRKCVELALEDRTETVSLLLRDYEDSDADWLWETNGALTFQNVSPRFARAIGYSVGQLEATTVLELLERDASGGFCDAAAQRALSARIAAHTSFTEALVAINRSDGLRCIELSARPRFNSQGRFVGYRGVGSDVTEARRAADRIAHMARHDALTGLPNRAQLLEALADALDRSRGKRGRCAILLIDLDRFKSVNDSLGHVAGDHLLRQVSARFDPLLSPGMLAGRLGGDEFAIVIPSVASIESIKSLCTRIVDALKQPFLYNDQHLFVGASIGVAHGPDDGDTVEELIRNADLALYRAKAEGGDDLRFYEPGLHARAEERRQVELALRTALDAGHLRLVYQPIIDAKTSRIRGFEALLRWRNPELGELTPTKFIPIAEETGLIGRIGEWALRTACAEAATWPKDVTVAVNVSPLQLQDQGFMLTLVSALSQSGLDPNRLELELTETIFLQITPCIQKVLQQIRSLGVRLAIDDFGTGYSSLGYLRDTNFNTLKIDRSFTASVRPEDPGSSAIVKAVVALAGSLGMRTIAEGIETAEQLDLMRALGCDCIQGYVVSNAVAPAGVKRLLKSGGKQAAA